MGAFVFGTCLEDSRVAWYSSDVQGSYPPGPAVSICVKSGQTRTCQLSGVLCFVACRNYFLLIEGWLYHGLVLVSYFYKVELLRYNFVFSLTNIGCKLFYPKEVGVKQPKTSEIRLCLICEMKCIPLCLEATTSVPMADGLATSLKTRIN